MNPHYHFMGIGGVSMQGLARWYRAEGFRVSGCDAADGPALEALRADGIGVNVHYIPVHLQPWYRRLGFGPGQFPQAEAYYAGAISLPLFPTLREDEQDRVVDSLARALR